MHRREDNALEVWLKTDCGNMLAVGWLTNVRGDEADRQILITSRKGNSAQSFKLERHHREFDRMEIVDSGAKVLERIIAEQVPGYAFESTRPDRHSVRFSWPTLVLTPKDYEWIFDLPTFEPYDEGEPDFATREAISTIEAPIYGGLRADRVIYDEVAEGLFPAGYDFTIIKDVLGAKMDHAMLGSTSTTTDVEATGVLTAEKVDAMMKSVAHMMPARRSSWSAWSDALADIERYRYTPPFK